jgi:hypothetical protein
MKSMSQRTIGVLLGVEGNELIEHSFLLTIPRIPGLIQSSVRRFLDTKEAPSNEELPRGCVVVCGRLCLATLGAGATVGI